MPRDNEYNRMRTEIALEETKYFVPTIASTLIRNTAIIPAAFVNNIDALVSGEIDEDTFIDKFYAEINVELSVSKDELGL